jgi:hypothetical protein
LPTVYTLHIFGNGGIIVARVPKRRGEEEKILYNQITSNYLKMSQSLFRF